MFSGQGKPWVLLQEQVMSPMSLKAELPFFTEQMRFEKEPNTITITRNPA